MATRKKSAEPLVAAPQRVRGYYNTPLGRFRSVTTILEGGYPKEALIGWAGRMAAECAVDNIPWLATLRGQTARDEATKWVKVAHNRYKDAAADIGTLTHRHLEARLLGAPTQAPADVLAPYTAAYGRDPELTDELTVYFAAVDDFLDTMAPDLEAAELVVANPLELYAGTGDAWLTFPRHRITIGPGVSLVDGKSGSNTWGETGMQLGAYRRCPVGWLKDGTQVEPPRTERGLVFHIRPDTYACGWALVPADTSDAVHDVFRHVQAVDAAKTLIKNRVLGDPIDPLPDHLFDPDEIAELTELRAQAEMADVAPARAPGSTLTLVPEITPDTTTDEEPS